MKIAAVIAAGGTGTRIGARVPKQFLELGGEPVLLRTLSGILAVEDVRQVVIALPAAHIAAARRLLERRSWRAPVACVRGGATRQESVHRAVERTAASADLILVHDAVRPLCDRATMERVIAAAWETGGAVPALPATETIQRVSRAGRILKSPPRDELYAIQTPQGFRAEVLRGALARARRAGFAGTDESSVVRWAGHAVKVVEGSPANIKITRPIDLEIAEVLAGEARGRGEPRVGHGLDYHRLVSGRKLIPGGVEIPFDKGLLGHSDADALAHAICDALLGAAGLGDIGHHFSDRDPAHRDRPSLQFLAEVRRMLDAAGWTIRNVDATVLAEKPRLAPYRDEMRRRIAVALGVAPEQINVKATTTEGLDAEGRGEAISAQAVALIERAARGAR
jgi:2-C-methyl-D-erythritol 4-phosphate cytidylyltransferase/2-C-methyl-D-erythritol 2,4-cyclodiphosphate synthase